MTKTIYLANPYGFSAQQRMTLLPPIVAALEELGLEVWEPFARNNQVDFLETGWAYRIGQRDFEDVVATDAIFAVVNGVPPDEGVMVELGMAIALGKPVFLFRDDFRPVVDSEQYPLNLMLFTGLPEEGWQHYFYTSVEGITSPEKALARWAMDTEICQSVAAGTAVGVGLTPVRAHDPVAGDAAHPVRGLPPQGAGPPVYS